MYSRSAPHIILASASSGSGHSQAAEDLATALRSENPALSVQVVNIYDFMTPLYRSVVETGWQKSSLTPGLRGLYRTLHHLFSRSVLLSRMLHWGFRRVADRLRNRISLDRLQDFIALHPAAVPIGARLKSQTGCRLSVIATDFVLHNIHCHDLVDKYFVAPQSKFVGSLSKSAERRGEVFTFGIPIGEGFRTVHRYPVYEDDDESFRILVSFGAFGYRGLNNLSLLIDLIEQTEACVKFTILAGRDPVFFDRTISAVQSIAASHRVEVLGFIDDTSELMRNSDLLIGKAGGLTTSEAFATGLPLVILDTLPGQEEYNATVVEDYGAGIWSSEIIRIIGFIEHIQRSDRRMQLRYQIRLLGRSNSSRTIADTLYPHVTLTPQVTDEEELIAAN
jgi:processive 1,2-diacylglycerol beta-glucosyltransferase